MHHRFSHGAVCGLILFALPAIGQTTIGFEHPYAVGPIDGQQGWSGWNHDPSTTGAVVANANPYAGSQHLRLREDSSSFQQNLYSPTLLTTVGGPITTTMQILLHQPDAGFGPSYMISAYGPGFELAWLFWIDSGVAIRVSDSMGSGGGINTVLTDAQIVRDVYRELRVEMDPTAGTIRYYLDNHPLHTGPIIQYGSVWQLEIIRTANPALPDANFMDIDDLVVTPSPSAAFVLVLGGVLAIGRSRSQ